MYHKVFTVRMLSGVGW